MRNLVLAGLILSLLLSGCSDVNQIHESTVIKSTDSSNFSVGAISKLKYDKVLILSSDRYPETFAHIAKAIAAGHSSICTLDRAGAERNRALSLRGVATKKGFDRDEWPMAICEEGGEGADIMYVTPKDNRGAGSFIGNQLEDYSDGTRVLFLFGDENGLGEEAKALLQGSVVYDNCSDVRAAGAAPIHKGQPGYSSKLDKDGDGIACE